MRAVALLLASHVVLLASVAHAQPRAPRPELDPATLSVLDDPPARRARIRAVRLLIDAADRDLAALDRTPLDAAVVTGAVIAAGGGASAVIGLFGMLLSEVGDGLACGVSTLAGTSCSDGGLPGWTIGLVVAGLVGAVAGLATLLVGLSERSRLDARAETVERRLDGRRRELQLLESLELRAGPDGASASLTLGF